VTDTERAVAIAIEALRREWEDGHRRFQGVAREPVAGERLQAQLEVVTDELRKRVGQTFTLDELADTYARADDWVRDAVSERAATPGWPRNLALVQDAAFYLYQRGAVDYGP
jgi:hypothetical protein